MTRRQAEQRILALRKEIETHRHAYHVEDRVSLSEAALDSLKHELYTLEQQYPDLITPDSPTQRVGGEPQPEFGKVQHHSPMLSMEDVFTFDELSDWAARIAKLGGQLSFETYCMVKIDGLAMSLVYEDGTLRTAATRGDGKIGEDVTANVKTIEAVPLTLRRPSTAELKRFLDDHPDSHADRVRAFCNTLNGRLEVRGEVYMTKKDFDALNARMKKEGSPLFANPRNVAAGSVRQLDSKITASRKLSFYAWDMIDDVGCTTHAAELALLRLLGIPVNGEGVRTRDMAAVQQHFEKIGKKREALNYWIDGVVVRVNSNAAFSELGVVGKTPRGLVAYKFPAEQATTVVREVHWQVGRTGVLTPLAVMDPVFVAGTTVRHATLHNADEIERLGLKIGDTVVLEKAGDIIPKIIQILPKLRTGKEKNIVVPKVCPACGLAVGRRAGEVAVRCDNKGCPGKNMERLAHFVAKSAFDIDGLGPKILEQLQKEGLVSDPSDIFTLTKDELIGLDRFAEKSADNTIAAIEASKRISLPRFLVALGMIHVGEETAADLAEHFGSIERIAEATFEELSAVPNIGEVVAKSIFDWFHEKHNIELVHRLEAAGVRVEKGEKKKTGPFTGQTFVFTGEMDGMTRDEAKQKVRALGGQTSESVSKKTTYVVAGSGAGSKLDTAKKLGVTILDEEGFLRLVR